MASTSDDVGTTPTQRAAAIIAIGVAMLASFIVLALLT